MTTYDKVMEVLETNYNSNHMEDTNMTQASYNPFRKQDWVETEHGIITNEHRRYFTHRKPEHVFKKYQAFGISLTELEICHKEHVDHIVIKYHGNKRNTIYKIPIKYLEYMETYDNKGDVQILIPIKEMKVVGVEKDGD